MSTNTTLDRVEVSPRTLDPRRDALRDLRIMAPGVIPFGIFLGLTITVTGTGTFAGLFGSGLVYGGSAQLATVTVLHLGSGLLAAVAAGVVVNARFLLYGAALEPWFHGHPRWFRLLGAQFVLDQTYLSAVRHPAYRGSAQFRRYWLWLALSLLAVWTAALSAGITLAPLIPDMPHLVLVGTAMFVAMLVPRLIDLPSLVATGAASLAALVATQVLPNAAVLAGAAAGVIAAWLVRPGSTEVS
jgi:predicted branched-subunit amino acid permease